ncbi:MAG: recombinase family protein [Streptosporangiaceae bacterium]
MSASGAAVTIVVHEHKRLGRGIELAALAEQLRAADIGLEFLTGELQGSHAPSGVVFTVLAALSGMEREYIRDRALEGHESARARGKSIGGAAVIDEAMLAVALHLRGQELSLRDIATRPSRWRAGDFAAVEFGGVRYLELFPPRGFAISPASSASSPA